MLYRHVRISIVKSTRGSVPNRKAGRSTPTIEKAGFDAKVRFDLTFDLRPWKIRSTLGTHIESDSLRALFDKFAS